MRAQLTDIDSIEKVISQLTLDEKLNLVGEYTACETLGIPDMNIPPLFLLDGATGVNGDHIIIDFISSEEKKGREDFKNQVYLRYGEFAEILKSDLDVSREKYADDPLMQSFFEFLQRFRPEGKHFMIMPSGINIGAAFDNEIAYKIGEAIGEELRSSGVDLCMGPNVDINRDPLAGRGYEMYGEDHCLVSQTSAAVVSGIQAAGVAATAKHFLVNNQETNRNTKDTHVSERVLREVYSRGFASAIRDGKAKCIMSAYNAVNGEFTSYSKKYLTDLLRNDLGFDGVVVSDWGAVKDCKEKSLEAGMDLLLCGPNDMSGVKAAIEKGTYSVENLDSHVRNILKVIVELNQERKSLIYDPHKLKKVAYDTICEGSVLLKNNGILPMEGRDAVSFFGEASKQWMDCGTGSTNVMSGLHSHLMDEFSSVYGGKVLFEDMENANVVIYASTASSGENLDRKDMELDEPDRNRMPQVLKEAKEKGKSTVVILNIAAPVDMRDWIEYADAILVVFIPGCMGGKATADMLIGTVCPAGKLPVTFPLRIEDTPTYPNFPGEHNDVYYGEGIFVGYKNYEKRKMDVMYPFGFGLSYTDFVVKLIDTQYVFDTCSEKSIEISVKVKNVGTRKGSQVVQVYGMENKTHVIRPLKELYGYKKVELNPGEEKIVEVTINKDPLMYYDIALARWVTAVGGHTLYVGTSSRDIVGECLLEVKGEKVYTLNSHSIVKEIFENEAAIAVIDKYTDGMMSMLKCSENAPMVAFNEIGDFLKMVMITRCPDAVKLGGIINEIMADLAEIE